MSKIQDALKRLQSESNRNGDDERLEIPTLPLATIAFPRVSENDQGEDSGRPVVKVDFDLLRESGLLAPVSQQKNIADQYRLIKRPLLDNVACRGADQSPDANLIMVASALPGDGKTFNCMNLALSMATEKDTSVVLVDADVAKPHISTLLGIDKEPGLIDLLMDVDRDVGSMILRTSIPRLRVLPAGRHDEHATELLASRRMAAIVTEMSTKYPDRVVIFDSPPLMQTSEARVLASLMGQIVMVVCSSHTPQHAVLGALASIDQDKAISLILNQSSGSFDGYGHYGYGGYGR